MKFDPTLIGRAAGRIAAISAAEESETVETISNSIIGIVQTIHSDYRERNLYLSPAQSDRALMCAESGQWVEISPDEVLYRLVAAVLTAFNKSGRIEISVQPEEVARAAAPGFEAHLTNLANQAEAGVITAAARRDCRLPSDPLRTWYFCNEAHAYKIPEVCVTSIAMCLETLDKSAWGFEDPDDAIAAHSVVMFDSFMLTPAAENHSAFEHAGVAYLWSYKGTTGEWKPTTVAAAAREAFLHTAQRFAMRVRRGETRPEDARDYAVLQAVADYLTTERDGETIGPKPALEALAASGAAHALFRRRSDRARAYYAGKVTSDRSSPCSVGCGCSRSAARRIILEID